MTDRETAWALLVGSSFSIELNLNDVFDYATADSEKFLLDDFEPMMPVILEYRGDAFIAYAAVKRGQEPLPQYQTVGYARAKSMIKALRRTREGFMEE